MTTKLKINLPDGTVLEIEGEETFVREIYEDHKQSIQNPSKNAKAVSPSSNETTKSTVSSKKRTISKSKESYAIVKTLDLSGATNKQSLKDFYDEKSPTSGFAKNAVFVYYLQKIMEEKNITIDHIYTCYKAVKTKIPALLRQNLFDTSSKNGYITTESLNDITITTVGENFIEHDLPKEDKKK